MDLTDERVFADFVRRIVQGEDIVLKSDGSASRPFCYLADATEGLLTVLLKGQGGTAYNLMNDEAVVCIKDLANLLAGLFPERGVRVILPKPSERDGSAQWNPGYLVATQRIRQLGWRPSTSVESGFRRTILTYTQRASDPEAAHPVLRQGAFSR
jgi:nucleoside-diphosphate-sugar epimerase